MLATTTRLWSVTRKGPWRVERGRRGLLDRRWAKAHSESPQWWLVVSPSSLRTRAARLGARMEQSTALKWASIRWSEGHDREWL